MKQKFKNTKGITLVALIITIIVLLILAVVAITSIGNSNIIKHAQNGKDMYEQAKNNEAQILAGYESNLDEYTKKDNAGSSESEWLYMDFGEKGGDSLVYYGNTGTEVTLQKNDEITAFQAPVEDFSRDEETGDISVKLSEEKITKKLGEVESIYLWTNDTNWNIYKNDTLIKTMTPDNATIKKVSTDYEIEKKLSNIPTNLEEYVLLDGTEYFGEKSQWDDTKLKKFTLPNTLQRIAENGMIYFTKVEELKIPTSVSYVGRKAFSGWSAEQKIDITGCDTSGWDANWKEGCNAIIVGQ